MSDKKCFHCDEAITPENNGCVINQGLSTEMCMCNDCHYIEFEVNITKELLIF